MKFTDRLRDGAGCTSHIAAADIIDELDVVLRELIRAVEREAHYEGVAGLAWGALPPARAALDKLESLSK